MEIQPVAHGHPTEFSITIQVAKNSESTENSRIVSRSEDYNFTANFGDLIGGNQNELVPIEADKCDLLRTNGELIRCILRHTYQRQGEFSAQINVSNSVSFFMVRGSAHVETPITGIRVRLIEDSRSIIALGETVSVEASVERGDHVTFDWDFGDEDEHTPTG